MSLKGSLLSASRENVQGKKLPSLVRAQRAPTSNDLRYRQGTPWLDESTDEYYILKSKSAGAASWEKSIDESDFASDAEAQAKSSSSVMISPSNLAAEGFLQYADVELSSAEVKALATTQIELVAAQGAGSVIELISAQLKLNYGGNNAFTEGGDNLAIKYTDDSGVAVSADIESTGFIDATADTYTNAIPVADAIVAASAAENQALVLDNIGNNFAGNAADDNTLSVRVYYVVHSL